MALGAFDDIQVRFCHRMLCNEDRAAVLIRQNGCLVRTDFFGNIDDLLFVETDQRTEDRHGADFVGNGEGMHRLAWITLLISREDGEKLLEELSMTRFKARIRLLEALLQNENGKIETAWASKELGTTASVLRYFEEQGIASVESDEVYRNAVADAENIPHVAPAVLSISQQMAVNQILSEWEHPDPRPVLLHGVTGSGKTEVYMELIDKVIKEGGQAIVLIPEIALTYQTVRRFYGRFGDKVSVINSRLSLGERYDQFKRAKQGELQVMVGPRSALFTPFGRLRLIIIDEEHESSYKSENSPRYHARETAIHRAKLEGARVILGSATPSMEAYYRAKEEADICSDRL